MSAPTSHRKHPDAPVWFTIPWPYQRAALYLFAMFAVTLTLTQPSPDRAFACLIAVALVIVHGLMQPKPGEGADRDAGRHTERTPDGGIVREP